MWCCHIPCRATSSELVPDHIMESSFVCSIPLPVLVPGLRILLAHWSDLKCRRSSSHHSAPLSLPIQTVQVIHLLLVIIWYEEELSLKKESHGILKSYRGITSSSFLQMQAVKNSHPPLTFSYLWYSRLPVAAPGTIQIRHQYFITVWSNLT